MIFKLMADRRGYNNIIEETKNEWLEELLIYLGINIQKKEDITSSEFVEYLDENKIDIIDYPSSGALAVKYDQELVGEFLPLNFHLKKDKGEYYYEIEIEAWSIREDNISLS